MCFKTPARIPGYNGAYLSAVRGENPSPGIAHSTFYTDKLALWGDVIIVGDYYMPVCGIIAGYKF